MLLPRNPPTRASQSAVELERATSRQNANNERIAELQARAAAGTTELEQQKQQFEGLKNERETNRTFLENAADRSTEFPASRHRPNTSRHAMPYRLWPELSSASRLRGVRRCN